MHYVFKSSITGKAIERASIAELEALLREEYPEIDLETEIERASRTRSTRSCCSACCSSRSKG